MHLTLHADYGLRALLYLAADPTRVVSTTEIGRAYGISKNHLVRVAQSLRDAGLIHLTMGRAGGLTLAKAPSAIRIGQVVRALEPDLRIVECFAPETNTCPIAPKCGLSQIIGEALDAFLSALDRYTIAEVLRRSGPTLSSYFLPVSALLKRREPASGKAASGKPASGKPASGKAASRKATSDKPASGKPTSGKPASGKPRPRPRAAQRSSKSTRRSRRQVSSSVPAASMAPRVVSAKRSAGTPSRCR